MYLEVEKFNQLNKKLFREPASNLVFPYFYRRGLYIVVLNCNTTIDALRQLEAFEQRAGVCAFRGFVSVGKWNRDVLDGKQPLASMLEDEGLIAEWYVEVPEQALS